MDVGKANPQEKIPSEGGKPARQQQSRTVTSEALMQGASELWIAHRGEIYRLRLTRSGKLILHK
jgi:hemin uptake protein HemP